MVINLDSKISAWLESILGAFLKAVSNELVDTS